MMALVTGEWGSRSSVDAVDTEVCLRSRLFPETSVNDGDGLVFDEASGSNNGAGRMMGLGRALLDAPAVLSDNGGAVPGLVGKVEIEAP